MPSPVLTTVADLKVYLGVAAEETGEDVRLNALLCAVEQSILKYLNRNILEAEYTEYHSGNDRQLLVLKNRPLTAVDTVAIDSTGYGGHGPDAFGSATEQTLGVDFFPTDLEESESNPGMLEAICGVWPCGQQNIKVVYTAGYSEVPLDLVNAVHVVASEAFLAAGKGGKVRSETLGQYSYDLLIGKELGETDAQLASARMILAAYRDVRF